MPKYKGYEYFYVNGSSHIEYAAIVNNWLDDNLEMSR